MSVHTMPAYPCPQLYARSRAEASTTSSVWGSDRSDARTSARACHARSWIAGGYEARKRSTVASGAVMPGLVRCIGWLTPIQVQLRYIAYRCPGTWLTLPDLAREGEE